MDGLNEIINKATEAFLHLASYENILVNCQNFKYFRIAEIGIIDRQLKKP